jgi:hypothetical protein
MKALCSFPCPSCGKKGLHYSDHPHAFGYKDYEHIERRFCKKVFNAGKIEQEIEKEIKNEQQ